MNIALPVLDIPVRPRISPFTEEAHARGLEWAARTGLVRGECALRRVESARFAVLVGRMHPAVGRDDLILAVQWYLWFFMFDDQYDDGEIGRRPDLLDSVFAPLLALIERADREHLTASARPAPITVALADLWVRTRRRARPGPRHRMAEHIERYFDAYRWETDNRTRRIVPDPLSYAKMRRWSVGLAPVIDLAEICADADLPESLLASDAYRAMWRSAVNTIAWTNDLFSLRKEHARGEVNNLVISLREHRGCGWDEAVGTVATLIEEQVDAFVAAERELPRAAAALGLAADQTARRCARDLADMMRGNLDWSLETARYRDVEPTASGETADYLEKILPAA